MRTKFSYEVGDSEVFKQQLFEWSTAFEEVIWLDSNNYPDQYRNYDAVLAVDAFTLIRTDASGAFQNLQEYQETTKDWIFGYLGYDLKNDVEKLDSKNPDAVKFPDVFFFQPKRLFLLKDKKVELQYLNLVADEAEADFKKIQLVAVPDSPVKAVTSNNTTINTTTDVKVKVRLTKNQYVDKVTEVLRHIQRGDIFEANFCQEFYVENTKLTPERLFPQLNLISKTPFATYLRFGSLYALSASMERFLYKKGQKLISQPIKGTAKRSADPGKDQELSKELSTNPKERSENIMIVDLVRNDLSRVATKGSVQIEELCKVYSFAQVHQMISTISCNVSEDMTPVTVLKHTFPMGSMTGAPKISAMQIIEENEVTKRGLYSGSIGYITPDGDFDFNVVIRSILYNDEAQYASFSVGSAITAKSLPLQEYEECLLKARAMRQVLTDMIALDPNKE